MEIQQVCVDWHLIFFLQIICLEHQKKRIIKIKTRIDNFVNAYWIIMSIWNLKNNNKCHVWNFEEIRRLYTKRSMRKLIDTWFVYLLDSKLK